MDVKVGREGDLLNENNYKGLKEYLINKISYNRIIN